MITVIVGAARNRTELQIHRNIITARSKFFQNALSGCWSDPDYKIVDISKFDPTIHPKYSQRYLEAVYTKEYTDDQFILSDPCAHLINLCVVYVIAEAMLDVQTRNVIVRALYEFTINLHDKGYYYPNVRCIDIIYNGTASSSNPMRRLIVDMWFDYATAS
jgi:hypothetical protein